tara:strand:+ start:12196 stop:13413 length:1218 start_codon:yes stop_codon:yes gene_type:complete
MMKNSLAIVSTLVFGIASLASCKSGSDSNAGSETATNAAAASASESATTPVSVERKTTSPGIAIRNLNAQVESATQRVARNSKDLAARENLLAVLLSRTQYLGSFGDFEIAQRVVDESRALKLDTKRVAIMSARFLSSIHKFDEALSELDKADALEGDTSSLRETIAIATGLGSAEIVAARSKIAGAHPSYATLTKLAAAQSSMKLFAEADKSYQQALDAYKDVSPFPIAWIAFQRGVMWGESAGDDKKAYDFYMAAVARLPSYVVANVHLSELEVERGNASAAIERLRRIVEETSDPEPASRLAQFLAETDAAEAAVFAKKAQDGYERWLSIYPLAFADHACEFYLGAGNNPKRALELATLNLENRKTERAFGLAIEAAEAAGETTLACKLASEAKQPGPKNCD